MPHEQGLADYLKLSAKTSTFVSIDVVGSTALKTGENEQDIIYTFLAYHKLVAQLSYDHHGEVFHITGDGIMCRFERPDDGAGLARGLLENLVGFNKNHNRLTHPMSLRVGVHTGEVLESDSLSSGQLISQTIDVTAKLQSSAAADHARFSEATVQLLSDKGRAFQRVGWDSALGLNIYEYGDTQKTLQNKNRLPERARILIIEQELDEIVKLKKLLFSRHEPMPIFTQAQAILSVNSWNPHLIVESLDLPWNQSWDLLRELRADGRLSHVPIIAMSRQTTGEIIQRAFTLGANGFLRKPLDEQQILKRVEMVLREFYL